MIGETISHYRIVEKLGQGGMGEVYLAEDTRLGRKVALKFPAPELARDHESLVRFRNEARAAAELSHSNIATIYDFEEADGRPFLALEYLQGQSLRERVSLGPLPIEEVLRIGNAVASGLAEAHSHGITHRDIKSANVMLTEKGEVKILDFGLARRSDATQLTRPGTTLGTIGYMSPEQARGAEVDHRSDLWSLGVVLYEMVTGRIPFLGDAGPAILNGILHSEPDPVTSLRTGVPLELERIIVKCLAKDTGERYQHADELLADLKHLRRDMTDKTTVTRATTTALPLARRPLIWILGTLLVSMIAVQFVSWIRNSDSPGGAPAVPRLAVLPFENLGAPEDEYFADGIAEELTSRLARLSGLAVISRTSAMQYKRTTKSLGQIGKELGVEYVLEGTIRYGRSGGSGSVRITPQLIRVADDTHVWTDSFDHTLDDIFEVQSSIAQRVTHALNVTLLENEQRVLEIKPTENMEAYNAYLRALEVDPLGDSPQRKVDLLEKAIELDPSFALAHAILSESYSTIYHYGDRTEERLHQAQSAVEKALELEPALPEAHLAYGMYFYRGYRDYARAMEELAIAEEGLPNDSSVMVAIGAIHKRQGRFAEAIRYYERGLELNPRDASVARELGITNSWLRRYAEAERYFDLVISLVPDDSNGYFQKWSMDIARGNLQDSRETLEQYSGPGSESHWFLQELYEGKLDTALERLKSTTYATWGFFPEPRIMSEAKVYLRMGEQDRAVAAFDSTQTLLRKSIEESPDDYRNYANLGVVLAHLGQYEEAVRTGNHAVDLFPLTKDVLIGNFLLANVALIYAVIGDREAALDMLESLLSTPSGLSVGILGIDPSWDPLRDHPRFQALLERGDKVF